MSAVDNVRKLCAAKGLAISALEKRLGYGNGYFSSLKRGAIPSNRITEIATALNVSISALLDEKNDVQSGISAATLEQLKNSPATRALLHTISDMSEEQIRAYDKFIKAFRAENDNPPKRTIWRDEE